MPRDMENESVPEVLSSDTAVRTSFPRTSNRRTDGAIVAGAAQGRACWGPGLGAKSPWGRALSLSEALGLSVA